GDLTAAPTLDGTVVGTLAYMAPEKVRGAPADHRSDVFACGAILYEMLTGRRAFQGDSPADTMSAILREHPPEPELKGHSPALVRIIRRCLEKEPDRRFQSVRELRSAIESLSGTTSAAVSRTGERSVAVLPFADMSVQKDQEDFCEGMAGGRKRSSTRCRSRRNSESRRARPPFASKEHRTFTTSAGSLAWTRWSKAASARPANGCAFRPSSPP